jgi:hypothetical protein
MHSDRLYISSNAGRDPGSHTDFPSTVLRKPWARAKDAYPAVTERSSEISDVVFSKSAH